jgi:hypothetical protein
MFQHIKTKTKNFKNHPDISIFLNYLKSINEKYLFGMKTILGMKWNYLEWNGIIWN